MKKTLYIFAFVLLLLPLSFIINECEKENRIKIAIITNFSGPNGGAGISLISSMDQTLNKLGFNNYDFIVSNDSWCPDKIGKALTKVVRYNPDIIVLGTTSTALLKILDRLEKLNIPIISLSSTTTKITSLDDNIFSFALNLREEQKQIAEYFNKNGWNKIILIRETSNYKYTEPALLNFRKFYNGKIENTFEFESRKLNIDEFLNFAKDVSSDVDAFYLLVGYSFESGIIIQLLRKKFKNTPIVLTTWASENYEIFAGKFLNNIIIVHYFDILRDLKLRKLTSEHRKIFKISPTVLSLLGRESVYFINNVFRTYGSLNLKNFKKFLNDNKAKHYRLDKYGDSRRQLLFINAGKYEK